MNVLKLDSLSASRVNREPFPYLILDQAIKAECVNSVIAGFPRIEAGGSYNLRDVAVGPNFEQLVKSLDSAEFRRIICDKFDVEVMDLPILLTLRGVSRKKDGRIHTDSRTKVVTILIYLNERWDAETGRLRILRNGTDMEDYVEEIHPGPGSLLAFKVTRDCWHGYRSYEGRRQSIQVNFLTSSSAASKHRFFHGLSARLKQLKRGRTDYPAN